jgi:DNA polymerase III epsilon subunit-like protein
VHRQHLVLLASVGIPAERPGKGITKQRRGNPPHWRESIMVTAWIDTETCGLDPLDSAPIEIAILIYNASTLIAEKLYRLNPLNEKIVFHEGAYQVNQISEEEIKSYPPAGIVVKEIAEFLKCHVPNEKMVFAGYNAQFDYAHILSLFERYGFEMDYFFSGRMIDVYELVKKASDKGLLPKTKNQKLQTITKALEIPHIDAHSALGDIKSTRALYEQIYILSKGKR